MGPAPRAGASGSAQTPAAEPKAAAGRTATRSGGNIRVDLTKLDVLQNLVGELIIAENMFRHNPMLLEIDDENLTKKLHYWLPTASC